jgi:hypothetical protein
MWQLQAVDPSQVTTDGGDTGGDTGGDSGSEGDLPPGNWKLAWSDEFNNPAGSPPKSHWFNGPSKGLRTGTNMWRDCYLSDEDVYHDGKGNLVLRSRYQNGKNLCPYLSTNATGYDKSTWHLFGPGEKGIYIEWRANVYDCKAWGLVCGLWMHTTENLAYDGNPANGNEVDVLEYVPFVNPNNGSRELLNRWNSANIWQHDPMRAVRGKGYANEMGEDLEQDKYHTWGLEWYDNKMIYYFDGKKYFEVTEGVSSAESHGMRITLEIYDSTAASNGFNRWGLKIGSYAQNVQRGTLPAHFLVDYARVYERQ